MSFDPTANLLTRDVSFMTTEMAVVRYEIVKVFLRHPKEQRSSSGAMKDLLEINSEADWPSPVKAFRKWKEGILWNPPQPSII